MRSDILRAPRKAPGVDMGVPIQAQAVEHAAARGARIVWMPTLAAENHLRWEKTASWSHPASTQRMRAAVGIPVLNDDNTVRDEVSEVLDVIAKNDMVLASGHLHVSETWLVFEEAQRRGVERMVLTHPEDIVDASMNDVSGLAAMGDDRGPHGRPRHALRRQFGRH